MKLRTWQSECIDRALRTYESGKKTFFVMATPAGGKTTMASILSARLIEREAIDLVVCFTPTTAVCKGFKEELETRIPGFFDGTLGARGQVLTYQSLSHLNHRFWDIFDRLKILVIFDEIHHCGGDDSDTSTAWGEIILEKIVDRATYTLALSGTPWRTDKLPVTLASYCREVSDFQPDYIYGIQSAIDDRVCRAPRVIAIDNNNITLKDSSSSRSYESIKTLLEEEDVPYQKLLDSEPIIRYVLQQAVFKLCEVRYSNPNAGGLVVASSVKHAHFLANVLTKNFDEDCIVITHQDPRAQENLIKYKMGTTKWVVSVGMISEGTNIPRLQVCCHLSNIKTELHFRQVLGRNMRIPADDRHPYAYLYILAEQKLIDFARRLSEDLPKESQVLRIEKGLSNTNELCSLEYESERHLDYGANNHELEDIESLLVANEFSDNNAKITELDGKAELSIFGRYLKQLLEIENLRGAV